MAPDGWYLKGGFALELRLGGKARSTKDVDIDWTVGLEQAIGLLLDATAHDSDDPFKFTVQRVSAEPIDADGGERWTARADLAGREFERVALDIGFGKPPVVTPDSLASSSLLDFAGIAAVTVPALAIEQHLAEKLHAYTRTYAGDRRSSRVKDLVDIAVIAHTTTVDGDRLRVATTSIFDRRATHDLTPKLPTPPPDWARPWATLTEHLPAEADLASGFRAAAAFWDPQLAGETAAMVWDPSAASWQPSSP